MYDLLVIGGGPAGYVAAIRASQLGMKVALAEKKFLGGTCTNVGCIPTKAWLASSELFDDIKNAKRFGITVENSSMEMKSIRARTNRIVLKNRKGIEYLLRKNEIELFAGRAIVEDLHHARVGETEVEFEYLLLANGSHPIKFPPFDVEGVMTSDEIFGIDKIPEKLLIVGGGVIGVEMANFFSSAGSEVTIVEIMDHILPAMDTDAAQVLETVLKKRGVRIHASTKTVSVDRCENGYEVVFEGKEKIRMEFESILLSVGRKSNVSEDLDKLGLSIDQKGNVITDGRMATNFENVYAAGDINGKHMLAHVASREGIVAVMNMNGKYAKMDYKAVPGVIFTTPEVASVGKSELDLKKEGTEYKVGIFPMSALGRARTLETNDGFAKILSDTDGKILGITVVGPMATEVIMEGVMAVGKGYSLEEITEHIHPHPTISEIMMQAAEDGLGMPIDK